MRLYLNAVLTALGLWNSVVGLVKYQPEAVHIAYGEQIYDIVVTWSTKQDTKESIVEYGIGGFILTAYGNSTVFIDGGPKKHRQYIHRVWLKNLSPNSKYIYHCGSNLGWSASFYFTTAPDDLEHWSPRVVIFGDMGHTIRRFETFNMFNKLVFLVLTVVIVIAMAEHGAYKRDYHSGGHAGQGGFGGGRGGQGGYGGEHGGLGSGHSGGHGSVHGSGRGGQAGFGGGHGGYGGNRGY